MYHKSWHRSFGGAGPHNILAAGRQSQSTDSLPALYGRRSSMEERPVVGGVVGGSTPLGDPRYELPETKTQKVEAQPMEVSRSASLG